MKAKEAAIDHSGKRESIERSHDKIVYFLVELVKALCSKIEESSELSTLVISSEHEDSVRMAQLEAIYKDEAFDTELSSVNIISKEEVLGLVDVRQ